MPLNSNYLPFLSEEQEDELWRNCLFIFDSSALLQLYFYSEQTRSEIKEKIFGKLKNRLFIPAHVQFEYLKNKNSVIRKSHKESYSPLVENNITKMKDNLDKLKNDFDDLKNRTKNEEKHPFIEQNDITEFGNKLNSFETVFSEFIEKLKIKIQEKSDEIIKLEKKDAVFDTIEELFAIGEEYKFETIEDIIDEGERRYKNKIPPGYLDEKEKAGIQIYGDLIIWNQVLDFASKKEQDVIFICNDVKDDWCEKDNENKNRIKNPREELIREFFDTVNKKFWMYTLEQFIFKANKLLKSKIDENSIRLTVTFLPVNENEKLKLGILEAFYFTPNVTIDVLEKLKSLVVDDKLDTIANNNLVGDPNPGVPKQLKLKYSVNNLIIDRIYHEGERIMIP